MGTHDLSTIQDGLEQHLRTRIIPQYNRSDVLLNALKKTAGKGKNVSGDATFGTTTLQAFTDGQVVSTFNNDTTVPWNLPWCELGDALKLTGRAEDAASGDATDMGAQFVKVLTDRKTSIAAGINTELYTGLGSGSNTVLGLHTSAGPLDSTGTYAGIDRAVRTQWAGNVLANGGVPRGLSMRLLDQAWEAILTARSGAPTYGFAPIAVWNALARLAGDKVRIVQEAYIRGETVRADMGFQAITVHGVPIFMDAAAPSGTITLLNEQHVGIEYLPAAPTRMARGKVLAMVPLAGTPQEQLNALMRGGVAPPIGEASALMALLIDLHGAGNFDAWQLVSTLSLWCDQPNANALIKDIDTN